MTEATFAVLALVVLGWAVTSGLLARVNINGPLLLTAAGYLLANPDWGPLSVDYEAASIHRIAELTLALLLFADASRVSIAEVKRDAGSLPVCWASGCPSRWCSARSWLRGSSTTSRGHSLASWAPRWRRRTPP